MTGPRNEAWRPRLHFTPRRNWINDPNGLVWFDGEYHLFYQYNPFGDQWGHMSWGHAVSTDLVDWQELPVAIPEDERASIYSGSVVVDERNSSGFGRDGKVPLVAIYTGCLRRHEGGQAQELAYSLDRGRTWTKYAHNPVLDLGQRDFRDPKVFWHGPTQRWVMVVVLPDERCAKFYAATDLKAWTWLSDFAAPFDGDGIWECPDLIPLRDPAGGTAWLFKVDVFGGHPSGGTGARLFVGSFDGTRFTPEPEDAPRWADFGADFYAALSWANLPPSHAAPLWLGWLSCHRYAKHVPTSPWRGAMSLPRELALERHGTRWTLLQRPLPALQRLRGQPVEHAAITLAAGGRVGLLPAGIDGRTLEIELELLPQGATCCGLELFAGNVEATRVGVDTARGTVFVDRSRSGFLPPGDALYPQRREAPWALADGGPIRLRIFVDASTVEVFAGRGEAVLSEQVFPAETSRGLAFFAEGGTAAAQKLRIWPLAAARFD